MPCNIFLLCLIIKNRVIHIIRWCLDLPHILLGFISYRRVVDNITVLISINFVIVLEIKPMKGKVLHYIKVISKVQLKMKAWAKCNYYYDTREMVGVYFSSNETRSHYKYCGNFSFEMWQLTLTHVYMNEIIAIYCVSI